MVHGCVIGEGSLVGINAVVLDGAVIGKNCLIGAGALVTGGTQIPDNSLVLGSPAKVKATLSESQVQAMRRGATHYVSNAQRFVAELEQMND
jgi:carbonic anhydrase/acetyltransferase-like protein (isoleucine patch superfamily)